MVRPKKSVGRRRLGWGRPLRDRPLSLPLVFACPPRLMCAPECPEHIKKRPLRQAGRTNSPARARKASNPGTERFCSLILPHCRSGSRFFGSGQIRFRSIKFCLLAEHTFTACGARSIIILILDSLSLTTEYLARCTLLNRETGANPVRSRHCKRHVTCPLPLGNREG